METETLLSSGKGVGIVVFGGLAVLLVAVFLFYKPAPTKTKFEEKDYPRPFTLWGSQGTAGRLSCPESQKININRATYMCALNASGRVDRRCDPFFSNGNYNPATTFDAQTDLKVACNGKTTCSFKLPNVYETGENECNCDFRNVVLNATYSCVP